MYLCKDEKNQKDGKAPDAKTKKKPQKELKDDKKAKDAKAKKKPKKKETANKRPATNKRQK